MLTGNDIPFVWNYSYMEGFDQLCSALTCAPILLFPMENEDYFLDSYVMVRGTMKNAQ